MNRQKKKHIRYYAYKVRTAVDKLSEDEDGDTLLAGYCARASAMLSYELSRVGVEHNIVYGHSHIYIECDGYIIDVTATQFNGRGHTYGKTLIRKAIDMHAPDCGKWWTKDSKVFTDIGHLVAWQNNEFWPVAQMVNENDLDYLHDRL